MNEKGEKDKEKVPGGRTILELLKIKRKIEDILEPRRKRVRIMEERRQGEEEWDLALWLRKAEER